MQDYKILQNYIDEEIIYEGKNYNLYKLYREASPSDYIGDECFFMKIWPVWVITAVVYLIWWKTMGQKSKKSDKKKKKDKKKKTKDDSNQTFTQESI